MYCMETLLAGLQVLLTMSRQPKHEQTVLQLLKKRVVQACEEQAASSSNGSGSSTAGGCNGWMSGLQQVNRCPSIGDLQHGLLKAIRYGAVCAGLHGHPTVHCASQSGVTSIWLLMVVLALIVSLAQG
jgi:hypothetical protein